MAYLTIHEFIGGETDILLNVDGKINICVSRTDSDVYSRISEYVKMNSDKIEQTGRNKSCDGFFEDDPTLSIPEREVALLLINSQSSKLATVAKKFPWYSEFIRTWRDRLIATSLPSQRNKKFKRI